MIQRVAAVGSSMVEAAYEQIRRRILDNVWPPGHRALEQEVALELGMSRTPVREALAQLQNEVGKLFYNLQTKGYCKWRFLLG